MKTLDIMDTGVIKKAAAMMNRARCCIFAGVGDSCYFCEMLGKNLRCLNRTVQYYQQIHDMFYAVRHGSREDLLIVISARGENNRLLKLSDINLFFWGEDREVNGYNVTDRSGLMMVIRLLSEEFRQNYME